MDEMIHLATLFDSHYLDRGVAFISSLQHHLKSYRLYVLACDDLTAAWFQNNPAENVIVMPLFHLNVEGLKEAHEGRTHTEFMWTLASVWSNVCLSGLGAPHITYVDADCFLFGDLAPLYQEIGGASVAITPHRFPPALKHKAINGTFNVGVVYFKNDPVGRECAKTWSDQCIEWCYYRNEDGKFGDQMYLDTWPQDYGAHIIQHLGVNLAPWNQEQYIYTVAGSKMFVNTDQVLIYHFHRFLQSQWATYQLNPIVHEYLYTPYAELLQAIGEKIHAAGAGDNLTRGQEG